MNNQVVVIGLGEEQRSKYTEILEDNALFRDGIGIVQFRTASQAQIFVRKLEPQAGVSAYLMSTYNSIVGFTRSEYVPLPRLTPAQFYFSNGHEQVAMVSNEVFSLCDVRNRDLEEINSFGTRAECIPSSTGLFICLYEGNKVVLRAGDSRGLFNELTLKGAVLRVGFSPDDRFIAVFTRSSVEVWDVFRGMRMVEEGACGPADVVFDDENVYFLETGRVYSLESGASGSEAAKIVRTGGRQKMKFYDGRVQRIEYSIDEYSRSKTQANVDRVDFFFSKTKCYAVIRKEIQKERSCFIETYGRNEMTMTPFKGEIVDVKVSDDFFVMSDTGGHVSFFKKDKFRYSLVKQIKKEDGVILSLSDDVCCLYDSGTSNIEFYDHAEPRSVYTHQLCNRVEWSSSGLFVASMSAGPSSSGLVQLFNKNGKLLWKKVFSKLVCFSWRPFALLTEGEKEDALRTFDPSAIEIEEDEVNNEELLSRWKSYLLSKKQLLEAE
jgi:AraC-like DNA-binding protein